MRRKTLANSRSLTGENLRKTMPDIIVGSGEESSPSRKPNRHQYMQITQTSIDLEQFQHAIRAQLQAEFRIQLK